MYLNNLVFFCKIVTQCCCSEYGLPKKVDFFLVYRKLIKSFSDLIVSWIPCVFCKVSLDISLYLYNFFRSVKISPIRLCRSWPAAQLPVYTPGSLTPRGKEVSKSIPDMPHTANLLLGLPHTHAQLYRHLIIQLVVNPPLIKTFITLFLEVNMDNIILLILLPPY